MDPIIVALLLLLPFISARYLHSWWAVTPGTVIAKVRLGWQERLRLHAQALAVGAALLVLDVALRGPRPGPFALVGCGLLLSVAVPLQYIVTDQSLQLGRSRCRRWTEFAGLSARRGQIRLRPVSGGHPMVLRLSEPTAAELEPILRHQIWTAYRGDQPAVEGPRSVSMSASKESRTALRPTQG